MTTHHFEVEDAVEFGVHEAVLIQNLRYWIQHNKANGKHEHDGRTWTYNSAKAFAQLFPYFSADQVKRIVKKLVEGGVVVTRALSENAWDRVNWYAFKDEVRMLSMPQSHATKHSAESPNASSENAQSTGRIRSTDSAQSPNHSTDKKQDVNADAKAIVEQKLDASGSGQQTLGLDGEDDNGQGGKPLTEKEKIVGIFDYWRKCMNSPKSKLDDKRKGVIRRALKAGYSPRDLCRAIQGCKLTPHNQGENDRGQKYLGIHVCLKDADQIDRFMANSKAPPQAPEKKGSGQIPGWWKVDELAKQQGALVGVIGPHPHETRDMFHSRIRAAIDNGGKPVVPATAPVQKPTEPEVPKVEATPEQIAGRRAALKAALKPAAVVEGLPAATGVSAAVPVGAMLGGALVSIVGGVQASRPRRTT
ncbi:hypothetical protein AB4Y45_27825 [Paraburkholderia sp. EG287A]|uniref:hypothetical protein n=1 Tax=Paraburkholderia sp. EG287A TaxID=3237012 RepID=UPI0034D2D3F1